MSSGGTTAPAGMGGSVSAGGRGGTGMPVTGGMMAPGGMPATGGTATGGMSVMGGMPAMGGMAMGGMPATGGMPVMGGMMASGGMMATGGTPASGGAAGAAIPGLAAHWKLDATSGTTAVDSAGIADNATYSGLAGSWVAGKLGNGYRFPDNDSDGKFAVSAGTELNAITGAVTVATWYFRPSFSGNGKDVLVQRQGQFGVMRGIGQELCWAGATHICDESAPASQQLGVGKWYHVAATFDDTSDQVKLYLDGVEVFATTSTTDLNGTGEIALGRHSQWGSDWSNNAVLDDIRIYNRALSAAEIAALVTP